MRTLFATYNCDYGKQILTDHNGEESTSSVSCILKLLDRRKDQGGLNRIKFDYKNCQKTQTFNF